jgi:hypothetical protein
MLKEFSCLKSIKINDNGVYLKDSLTEYSDYYDKNMQGIMKAICSDLGLKIEERQRIFMGNKTPENISVPISKPQQFPSINQLDNRWRGQTQPTIPATSNSAPMTSAIGDKIPIPAPRQKQPFDLLLEEVRASTVSSEMIKYLRNYRNEME